MGVNPFDVFDRGETHMSMLEFEELVDYIIQNHSWFSGISGHAIKYIRPHFDTRTCDFYGVRFDGLRGTKEFFVVNENRDKNLYKWIMEFLNTPPDEAGWAWEKKDV